MTDCNMLLELPYYPQTWMQLWKEQFEIYKTKAVLIHKWNEMKVKCEVDTGGRENLVGIRNGLYLPVAPLQDWVWQLQECLWITSPRRECPGQDTVRDLLEAVLENAVKIRRWQKSSIPLDFNTFTQNGTPLVRMQVITGNCHHLRPPETTIFPWH